jgi:hypothetical protein
MLFVTHHRPEIRVRQDKPIVGGYERVTIDSQLQKWVANELLCGSCKNKRIYSPRAVTGFLVYLEWECRCQPRRASLPRESKNEIKVSSKLFHFYCVFYSAL